MVTRLIAGDYPFDRIMQYEIDFALSLVSTPLPLEYGVTWITRDLDLDGNVELVVQRGDGTNGFLDVHSAPTWQRRSRSVFPGKNVNMYPVGFAIIN